MYNSGDERIKSGCCSARSNNYCTEEIQTRDDINVQGLGCGSNTDSTWGLRGYPLASVYSPLQDFTEIYDCENALIRGTIFAQLDLPFVCGGMNGGAARG